jgi:pseudouridine-5'-phosphate glycosidase
VCAGVKSILDIGLTLEYLETHGVPVISVGQRGFPAFFTRDSGFNADFQLDTPAEQAASSAPSGSWACAAAWWSAIRCRRPSAMPKAEIDAITAQALQRSRCARRHRQEGHALPAGAHQAADRGRSLATNIALVKHNARSAPNWRSPQMQH